MTSKVRWYHYFNQKDNTWNVSTDSDFDKYITLDDEPCYMYGYLVYRDYDTHKTFITSKLTDLEDKRCWYNGFVNIYERFSFYKDNDKGVFFIAPTKTMSFKPWDAANYGAYLDIDFIDFDNKLKFNNYLVVKNENYYIISSRHDIHFYYLHDPPSTNLEAHYMYSDAVDRFCNVIEDNHDI